VSTEKNWQNKLFLFPENLLPFIKDTAIALVHSQSLHVYYTHSQGDTLKFSDISLTTRGNHAHVKCYS